MFSYETLDAIADSVNPVSGLVALIAPWVKRKRSFRQTFALNGLSVICVGIAYVLRAIDSSGSIWSSAGLDFSTHAAVFTAIASSLWQHGRLWRSAVVALGLCYAVLMTAIQNYHSVLDVISTVAAMLPLLVLVWWRAARSIRSEALA